ncbi:MAG: BspA family leucine-rich repeat surface protein [Prevotella sp.]|nr:BspA family leucine-rich repeat surface protein [Prevotella sp.]
MKRNLTLLLAFVAMFMGVLGVNAISPNDGAVIAEKDYTGGLEGVTPPWYQFGDGQDGSISSDPDGVAINVGSKTGQLWDPQVMLINEEIQLKRGGNYKVVVTAKFPCDGTLMVSMGSWVSGKQYIVDVVSTGDFQEVEINFPEYPCDCNNSGGVGDAHLLIQCGDFLGTTIVKKIQVWDLDAGPYAVLSDAGKTLTFYYDGNKDSYGENAYDLNEENCTPGWINNSNPNKIQKVVFTSSFQNARPVSTYEWFSNQPSLTEIVDIQYLNTSEVENMSKMFFMCSGLKELDLSGFDTRNVTDMSLMFDGSKGLTSLNLSSFDTQNVSNLEHMFVYCENLKILDLRSFNTSNVINMNSMFYYCDKLKTIAVGTNWNTANVESSDNMFTGCLSIVGGAGTTYNINKVDKAYAHIDGGESDPGYLSATLPEAYAVYNRSSDNVSTLTFYYDNLRNTMQRVGIKKYDLNEGYDVPGWISDNRYIEKVVFDESFKDARPTSTFCWFMDLASLDTFVGWENLNTSEVTNMGQMFQNCSGLTSVTLSGFDTQNVTDMSQMFRNCSGLTSISLSGFNTQNVTNMSQMFFGCSSLTSINLSGINTSNLVSANFMFSGCQGLTSLDLSSFNTSNVRYMNNMFNGCGNLKTITVGVNWTTDNVPVASSSNMFSNCTRLVGGAGTTYNSGKVDKEYAIADGLNGQPGYLTAVSYGITVSGKAVTFANKYDVLGNETVNYDDALNILTLINADVSSINIASTAPNDLHVNVNGTCKVQHASTKGAAFTTSIAKTTIEGVGKLTIISLNGIGIKINRSRTAALLVKDVDLEVGGKTGGIVGTVNATGRTFYSSLGFDNTNCTVARPQGVAESVVAINRLECIRCSMTAGKFDKVNHKVEANPMIIQRSGGISTDIDAIDNGQLTMDKSLPLYNLNGQRVSHPVKGQIYIQNGRKIKF